MAIKRSQTPNEMLQTARARTAAIVSSVLSLAAMGGLIAYLLGHPDLAPAAMAVQILWIAVFAFAVAAAVDLMRRRTWAQRFLLVFWLFLGAAALVVLIGLVLYEIPEWIPSPFGLGIEAPLAVIIAAAVLAVVLLVLASTARSRLRYGTFVAVSLMVAAALIVIVNLIAHKQPARTDVQMLGRYGLSQRSKTILKSVDDKIHLTCVYTGTDDATRSHYRPRTLEYLYEMQQEMRKGPGRVEVSNVTTDAQKDRLIARLWNEISGKSAPHLVVLKDFKTTGAQIVTGLRSEAKRWAEVAPQSNLGTWGLPVQISDRLERSADSIDSVTGRINSQLTDQTGLPNTQMLIRQAIEVIDAAEDELRTRLNSLRKIRQIPPTVRANRDEALKGLAEALAAAQQMVRTIGAADDPIPPQPSETLSKFVTAADKASSLAFEAAKGLDEIAGKQNATLLSDNPAWRIDIQARNVVLRTTLSKLVAMFADNMNRMKLNAEGLVKAAKEDHIKEVLPGWRKEVAQLTEHLEAAAIGVEKAVDQLTKMDEQTKQIFDELAENKLFGDLTAAMRTWLTQARALPELESTSLSVDITQDNIVIVETKGKAEVVQFDAVWPQKMPELDRVRPASDPTQRSFNGDSSISSKILAMTNEPFATVLITYFKPKVSPQMEQMLPMGLEPKHFSILQERLRQGNFQVEEWNLTERIPEPTAAQADRPRVLLILPPAPPVMGRYRQAIPNFGREHEEKIRGAIDDGLPAIFLAHYFWPQQIARHLPPISPPYGLRGYLLEDWGIDVKSDYRVLSFIPHEAIPGKFQIDPELLRWMTIRGFTGHPISRPLQTQRTIWSDLCPVVLATDATGQDAEPKEGLTVTSLLQVPPGRRETWATNRIIELVQDFRKSPTNTVEPNYEKGDLPAPFDVALAATRSGDAGAARKPTRIVVLPITISVLNGYLSSEVPVRNAKGATTLTDPPRANADLVTNSVYWLTGYEQYIAAGPVRITPVAMIGPTAMKSLWALCVIGLPSLVLSIGTIVMIFRRR